MCTKLPLKWDTSFNQDTLGCPKSVQNREIPLYAQHVQNKEQNSLQSMPHAWFQCNLQSSHERWESSAFHENPTQDGILIMWESCDTDHCYHCFAITDNRSAANESPCCNNTKCTYTVDTCRQMSICTLTFLFVQCIRNAYNPLKTRGEGLQLIPWDTIPRSRKWKGEATCHPPPP